jgi:hypothetical protein
MRSPMAKWLILGVLALAPSVALAQPGNGPLLGRAAWDFLCLVGKAPCLKFRLGVAGGGLISGKSAAPALGLQGAALLHLGETFDVGASFIMIADARKKSEGAYVAAGEGLLHIVFYEYERQRLLVELSGGMAEVHEPDRPSRPRGSGGLALSFEIGEEGAGGFFNVGFHVALGERVYGVPHAGVGLFF